MVSPADARIMAVGPFPGKGAPPGEWHWISMFLSPMDVHVNRTLGDRQRSRAWSIIRAGFYPHTSKRRGS